MSKWQSKIDKGKNMNLLIIATLPYPTLPYGYGLKRVVKVVAREGSELQARLWWKELQRLVYYVVGREGEHGVTSVTRAHHIIYVTAYGGTIQGKTIWHDFGNFGRYFERTVTY